MAEAGSRRNSWDISGEGGEGTVSVIDGETNQVVSTIGVGNDTWGVGVNPQINRVCVSNMSDGTVSVIGQCRPEKLSVSPLKRLRMNRSKPVTVTVTTGADDCDVEGIMVKANIGLVSRQFITVTPNNNVTDSNGQTQFMITAKDKTGI